MIQTPRSKVSPSSTKDFKPKQKEKEINNSSCDYNDSRDSSLTESRYREQVFIMQMESITSSKRKISGEHKFVVRRNSSVVGLKEQSFNEFSFQNRGDSFCEKDKESSSSKQNMENSPKSIASNDSTRKRSADTSSILGGYGFKRTTTPNFVNRPSGFFLERNNSVRSLTTKSFSSFHRPQPYSSGNLMPYELRSEQPSSDVNSPVLHPSIEDAGLREAELRANDTRITTLHSSAGTKDFLDKENQKTEEPKMKLNSIFSQSAPKINVLLEGFKSESPKPSNMIAGFDVVKEQSPSHERESIQPTKEKTAPDPNGYRRQLSTGLRRISPQAKATSNNLVDFSSVSHQATAIEPQIVKVSEKSKLNRSASNGMIPTDLQSKPPEGISPVRVLPLQKLEVDGFPSTQETKPSYGRVPTEPTSAKRSGRSHSASKLNFIAQEEKTENLQTLNTQSSPVNHQNSLKNCFSSSTKLSIKDKFKRNLLEVVKNEEDDISPIISVHKHNLSKPMKPILRQASGATDKFEFVLNSVQKQDSDSGLEKPKVEAPQTKPANSKENNSQVPKEGTVTNQDISKSRSDPTKEVPKRSNMHRNKNLLAMAREEPDENEVQPKLLPTKLEKVHSVEANQHAPIRIPLHKFEKMLSADHTTITGLSPSPIGKIDLSNRNNQLDFDSIPTPVGNTPVTSSNGMNGIGSHQTFNNQSMISATPSRLNETYYRSFMGMEDGISVVNLTNYVFTYENDEIEYEEKATNRSRLYSQDQILAGVTTPTRSHSLSPINNLHRNKITEDKRESFWQGRKNLLDMSPIQRKDSPCKENGANALYSRKESFASLSTIRGSQHPDITEFNQSMFMTEKPGINRQPSDVFLEEGSPKKHLSLPADSNKFKPFRTSKFSQESEGTTEATNPENNNEPKQESQNRLTMPVARPHPKFIQRSKSSGLGPVPEVIQEFASTQRKDSAPFSRLSSFQSGQNHLLVPPVENDPSKDRKKQITRSPSEIGSGPKSPMLKGAVLKRTLTGVIETNKLDKTIDDEGQKKINQYLLIKDLGK